MGMEAGKFSQSRRVPGFGTNSEKIQVCSTDMENERIEDEKQRIPAMEVFSNELIWKTLGRCLNVSDLKCCRLVSKKLNRMVIDETKFKDRVVMKVKNKKLTPEEFGKTEEIWKNIALNIPVESVFNLSNYAWLYPLLTEVEVLSLRLHGIAPSSTTIDGLPLLGRLLTSCKKLESLAFEPAFIYSWTCRISEGQETLKNVQHLEILKPKFSQRPWPGMDDEREEDERNIEDFCDNLRNLKTYRCYFTRFGLNPELENVRTWMEGMFLLCLSDCIYLKNHRHIESCSFFDGSHMPLLHAPGAIFTQKTPALKALDVASHQLVLGANVVNLIDYLNSRPFLEQLDISCESVMAGLIESIARHGRSLKKLKLLMTLGNLSDWIFLRESSMRELRLEDTRTTAEENEWIRLVMSNLPKSIEKLYLRGAVLERGQKKKQNSVTEPLKTEYFTRLDPQLVTQLSVFNAAGLVDNQVASFILKNFKMLRKLNLSEAETDDEGFAEIAGLKGLQFLTLKCCGITDVTLNRIRFLELRYLDVAGNLKTTVDGIKMTMKECPSLETVITPVLNCKFTKEDGQKICPRLKFLIQPNDGAPSD